MTSSLESRLRYIEKRPAAKRLQAQVVTTEKLPRAAVVTETIKNLAVVENSIGTNEISTRTIDANAVTNSELNNNAVTNRNITTDAIDARTINANSIIAGKISADAITAREIQANAITADEISANAITADKISANAITASLIQGKKIVMQESLGAVKRVEIDDTGLVAYASNNVITFSTDGQSGKLDAKNLIVENVNANNINVGTLTGRTVQTRDPLLGDKARVVLDGNDRTLTIYGDAGTPLGQLSALDNDPQFGTGPNLGAPKNAVPRMLLGTTTALLQHSATNFIGVGYLNTNSVFGGLQVSGKSSLVGGLLVSGSVVSGYAVSTVGNVFVGGNVDITGSFFAFGLKGSGTGLAYINSSGTIFRGPFIAGPTGPKGPPGPPGPPGARGAPGAPGGKSDLRLKQKVSPVGLGLNFINKLTPVSFAWNEQADAVQYGLIAQDVEKLMSSEGIENYGLVFRDENELAPEPGLAPSPVRRIDYNQLISPVIKSIQELSLRVDHLEKISDVRKDVQ
jgi:hypothetical protein